MKLSRLLFLLVIMASLTGCASKRYASKARKFDEAGLFADAAELYYQSVFKNPQNIEAKLGLQRNGQLVLMEKLAAFKTFYNNGAVKDAVYAYIDADKYFRQLGGVGVKLMFPAENSSYYEEMKVKYLEKQYSDAMMALDMEQFEASANMFKEIIDIDNSYKDANEHYQTAVNEPIYRNGLQLLEGGLYRRAFGIFSSLMTSTSGYKDAVKLRTIALDKATITVAAAPFTMKNKPGSNTAIMFRTKTIAAINNTKSPFIKMVNDNGLNSIGENMWNSFNTQLNNYIKNNRANISAKSVLTCNIVSATENNGNLRKIDKTGYLQREVEYKDSLGVKRTRTEYDKVKYFEYQQDNSLQLIVEFSLIDVATGNVIVSDYISTNQKSAVNYASYPGETQNLVPGYWVSKEKDSKEDKIFKSMKEIDDLRTMLKANKTIKTIEELTTMGIDDLATRISMIIENYNPEV